MIHLNIVKIKNWEKICFVHGHPMPKPSVLEISRLIVGIPKSKTDSFEHRQNQELGENLFCSWSSNAKAKCPGNKPVDSWYSEIKKYEFGKEPTSMGTGHFTQVVWKTTKKMGIAKARTNSGKIIVVANYEPAGNWIGQYSANVPPPKGS